MKMAMIGKMRVLNEFVVLNVFFSLDVSQCQVSQLSSCKVENDSNVDGMTN